jgi:hypothetical protein
MRIKSGSTYREGYRDGVSCAQWLQLVSGFVYLLIAHPKAPLWPVGSECTFPAPSTMSRHNNGIQRTICASVLSQKFIEKFQTMAAAEVEDKSPFVPLFQRGNFSLRDF